MKTKIGIAVALVLSVLFLAGCRGSANFSNGTLLTEAEARDIALKDAGLAVSEVTVLHIEKEADDGITKYDVNFRQGSYEYDYEIDAATGQILGFDKDLEAAPAAVTDPAPTEPEPAKTTNPPATEPTPTKPVSPEPPATTKPADTTISKEKAKAIALKHAGLKESEVAALRVELDKDDGIVKYDVEFRKGLYEYSYEINAETGKIIEWDKDLDD